MGWPATQFVEPCNKQFGLLENLRAAVAAGYTDALDDATFRGRGHTRLAQIQHLMSTGQLDRELYWTPIS